MLELTQPAVSQGLTRLRLLIQDPLFVRTPGGVQPTPKADRLAQAVRQALATLEAGAQRIGRLRSAALAQDLPHPHERHRRRPLPARR